MTPERVLAEYLDWRDSNGSIGFKDANNLAIACRDALQERNQWKELAEKAEAATTEAINNALAARARMDGYFGPILRKELVAARKVVEAARKYEAAPWGEVDQDESEAAAALEEMCKAIEAYDAEVRNK